MTATSTLFLGGARSGKSRLAQASVERCQGPLTYLATAEALDAEMTARIGRHRADRDARWHTVDCPIALPEAVAAVASGAMLVDCLTLWLSNLMLGGHDIAARTGDLLDAIAQARCPLTIVTNEVGLGIVPDHPLGRVFRDEAGRLNQLVAARVDAAFFVVAGLVLPLRKHGGGGDR